MSKKLLFRSDTVFMLLIISIILFISSCTPPLKKSYTSRAGEFDETEGIRNENLQNMILGGKLYDKWWVEVSGVEEPRTDHPLWALQTTNKRKGSATWSCKECHGWDYLGKDGAYDSGSHKTNFPGVYNVKDLSIKDIEAILLGATNPNHNYSYVLDYDSIYKLAVFLKEGLIDMRLHIDYKEKTPFRANPEHGKVLFNKECVKCHGEDGTQLNSGTDIKPNFVGTVAIKNPWEFIHKVRFGQPGTIMPALRIKLKLTEKDKKMPSGIETGYTMEDVIDILEYAKTLPKYYKID